MELTINIPDKKTYESLLKFLGSMGVGIVSKKSSKKREIGSVTLISESALAEDWDSKEDEKWDEVHNKHSFTFNWEGGLKELKSNFDGVKLQHHINALRK